MPNSELQDKFPEQKAFATPEPYLASLGFALESNADSEICAGVRPFQMLLTPICFSVALYASFVYGILYANLAAFPTEFEEERG